MIEQLTYRGVEELETLSLGELQALWELVPTDRQRSYRTAYDREVRNAGAIGSDDLEERVAAELLVRYRESALVPVGSRWARTPLRVQEAAKENDLPEVGDDEAISTAGQPSPQIIAVVGVMVLVFLGFMLFRLVGGSGGESDGVAVEATIEPSITPTLAVSPTATPLALEAQDDVITGGDSERSVAYPVNLQVVSADRDAGTAPPRVWVVQRREVRAAEWKFDSNPDIASFVNGMSVRPVIGIPWSEDNAALFGEMNEDTVFNLTMNTGAILRYEFAAKTQVLRSDTRIFRQVGPGLVLLLIGETGEDGLPTGTRTLVTATYPPEQELSRGGELAGLGGNFQEGEIGSSLDLGEIATVTLRNVSVNDETAPGLQSLIFDFDVSAGEEALNTALWRLELVDAGGQVYLPNSDVLDQATYGVLPLEIPARALILASVGYLVPERFPGGRLVVLDGRGGVASFHFAVETSKPVDVQYRSLDVRLVSVTTEEGQITTRLRIYNGQSETVTFTQDDIWLALGYAEDPPGPRNPAEGLQPFTLLPEQAVDLTLVWYWAGEPYGSLRMGAFRFALQIER